MDLVTGFLLPVYISLILFFSPTTLDQHLLSLLSNNIQAKCTYYMSI